MEKIALVFFEIWNVIAGMSLYLLFGFLIAGILHVVMPVSFIENHLSGKNIAASIKAALIGVPIPLCSCGVIPVATSLRKKGAGKGAVLSFLTSTPQTGIDSILVTYVMLGPVFTIFRVLIAFLSGIICGVVAIWLTGDSNTDQKCKEENEEFQGGDSCCSEDEKAEEESCCSGHSEKEKSLLKEIFNYGFIELPSDLDKTLMLGLLIAGLLGGFVPEGFFAQFAGNQIISMALMVVIGIPLYVCSTASVPVAAAFIKAGISPGAALVFLILGPATNAATIATITKSLGRKSVIIYLLTIALCALIAGFTLNTLSFTEEVKSICMSHERLQWYEHLSGIILLIVLLNPLFGKMKKS